MPRIVVDDASLFYRTFGPRHGTPVVLIHGATSDGATDWELSLLYSAYSTA